MYVCIDIKEMEWKQASEIAQNELALWSPQTHRQWVCTMRHLRTADAFSWRHQSRAMIGFGTLPVISCVIGYAQSSFIYNIDRDDFPSQKFLKIGRDLLILLPVKQDKYFQWFTVIWPFKCVIFLNLPLFADDIKSVFRCTTCELYDGGVRMHVRVDPLCEFWF